MTRFQKLCFALLAVAVAVTAASADLPGDAQRSFRAPVTLIEGGRRVVQVMGVSDEGLVVQAGTDRETIAWDTIKPPSAYEVLRKAADNKQAHDWLWIGVKMLELDDEKLAKRAFKVAARLNDGAGQRGEAALRLHRDGGDPSAVLGQGITPAKKNPDAKPGTKDKRGPAKRDKRDKPAEKYLWPILSEQEQQLAIEGSRTWSQGLLDKGRVRATPYESEHYIVYTNGGANSGRKLTKSLERMHRELKKIFIIPKDTVMYHGKCAIFVFDSESEFIDFEDRVFGNDADGFGGFHHPSETYSAVVTYTKSSDAAMNSILVHETTHAFMHRYRSWYRLPTWANEGLADFMAGHLVPEHDAAQRHWNTARTFIMNGGDPTDIMAQDYGSGWPDDNSYPVSHMIVRYMIKYKAPEFRAWIDDIKDGTQWVQAMIDRFSPSPDREVTPEVLAKGFILQMKSEQTYKR